MLKKKNWVKVFVGIFLFAVLWGIRFVNVSVEQVPVFFLKSTNEDVYRKIVDETFPIFRVGFNSGDARFSIIEEMNRMGDEVYGMDLKRPIRMLNHHMPLMNIGFWNRGLQTRDFQEMGFENQPFLTNQSSIHYEPEHKMEQTIQATLEDVRFIKEEKVEFNVNALSQKKINWKESVLGPRIFLYHTHANEAYRNEPSRKSNEKQKTVVDVGKMIAKGLEDRDIEVIHNATDHTKPDFQTAYSRAIVTAQTVLKSYPSLDIILDVHRDGLGSGQDFAPTLTIDGEKFAQVMIVVGTDVSGLEHPDWQDNLFFAVLLQKKLEELQKGITRPIYVSKYRYNQHLSDKAIILEVGGDGNTYREAERSAKVIARALASFF